LTWIHTDGPGDTLRLDGGTGDRPFPLPFDSKMWVAWEEGSPSSVNLASVHPTTHQIERQCEGLGDASANSGRPFLTQRGERALLLWEDVYSSGDPISDSDVRVTLVNTFGC